MSPALLISYGAFVLVGVAAIIFLLRRWGQDATLPLSPKVAEELLLQQHPAVTITHRKVTSYAVFFAVENGQIGLVRMEGHYPLVRMLAPRDITGMSVTPDELVVRSTLFADPIAKIKTDDPTGLMEWVDAHLDDQ
ncbi:MAG: hypothetical protein AAF986_04105 [Pseudomonadota bacterium]